MKVIDFRTPKVYVEEEVVIDPNFPELTQTIGKWVIPETELTAEQIAELEANEPHYEAQDEMTAKVMRQLRNDLLSRSDWINQPDATITDEAKAEWVAYRQALRDLSSHANWPDLDIDADFPTPPA